MAGDIAHKATSDEVWNLRTARGPCTERNLGGSANGKPPAQKGAARFYTFWPKCFEKCPMGH